MPPHLWEGSTGGDLPGSHGLFFIFTLLYDSALLTRQRRQSLPDPDPSSLGSVSLPQPLLRCHGGVHGTQHPVGPWASCFAAPRRAQASAGRSLRWGTCSPRGQPAAAPQQRQQLTQLLPSHPPVGGGGNPPRCSWGTRLGGGGRGFAAGALGSWVCWRKGAPFSSLFSVGIAEAKVGCVWVPG